MEIIKRIADKAKRGEYPIMSTIHGLIASAFHETGFCRQLHQYGIPAYALFCRERPAEMKKVFLTVATETLWNFQIVPLEAGAEASSMRPWEESGISLQMKSLRNLWPL